MLTYRCWPVGFAMVNVYSCTNSYFTEIAEEIIFYVLNLLLFLDLYITIKSDIAVFCERF